MAGEGVEYRPEGDTCGLIPMCVVVIPKEYEEEESLKQEIVGKYGDKVMVFFPAALLSSEKYDINKNGEIDLEDAQLALRLALKIDTGKDFESISLTDVQSILNQALKIKGEE